MCKLEIINYNFTNRYNITDTAHGLTSVNLNVRLLQGSKNEENRLTEIHARTIFPSPSSRKYLTFTNVLSNKKWVSLEADYNFIALTERISFLCANSRKPHKANKISSALQILDCMNCWLPVTFKKKANTMPIFLYSSYPAGQLISFLPDVVGDGVTSCLGQTSPDLSSWRPCCWPS